jgi:DNA adenine methylase
VKHMKTPISYYGGKQNMARHILPMIPKHTIYCEPFFGGGAIFFAKKPARLSAINDTNGWAITFYRQLQSNFDALNEMIQGTLHSEAEHQRAKKILKEGNGTDLETAWAFWVQTNMSFSGKMFAGFAFGNTGAKSGFYADGSKKGREGSLPSKTNNAKKAFPQYRNALESAEIFNRDALSVIKLKDTSETFHYIDPPYVGSNCGHYEGYTQKNFYELLELLATIKGKFLLSSYPNDALLSARERYGWRSMDIVQNLSVSGKGTEGKSKTECLTFNYALDSDNQQTLF